MNDPRMALAMSIFRPSPVSYRTIIVCGGTASTETILGAMQTMEIASFQRVDGENRLAVHGKRPVRLEFLSMDFYPCYHKPMLLPGQLACEKAPVKS